MTAEADGPIASSDDLYGLDPADFVAARDQLARRLHAEGQRDAAAELKKLRRPPPSAWALNRMARTDPERIDTVLAAATALRDALADGDADRRSAQASYRDAIDAAVAEAAALADITGEDMRTRIRTNLLAAGVDEALAVKLQSGILPDDQEAPGFGGTPTIGPVPPRARRDRTRPAGPKAVTERPVRPARPAVDEAARQQAQADELARKRTARQRAELSRELERLERRARRLTAQAEDAAERAATARAASDEATAAAAAVADRLAQL